MKLQLIGSLESGGKDCELEFSGKILHAICYMRIENHLHLLGLNDPVVAHHIISSPGRFVEKPVIRTIGIAQAKKMSYLMGTDLLVCLPVRVLLKRDIP